MSDVTPEIERLLLRAQEVEGVRDYNENARRFDKHYVAHRDSQAYAARATLKELLAHVQRLIAEEQAEGGPLAFIRRLATDNGAIVSSAACSVLEIAEARAEGRFWVDPETYCGYVLRSKQWREYVESCAR